MRSHWWSTRYPEVEVITIVGGPRNRGAVASSAGATRCGVSRQAHEIELPPWSRCELVLLHEVAHCVGPKLVRAGRNGLGVLPEHGPEFARVWIDLVDEFMSPSTAQTLHSNLRYFEVRVASASEVGIALDQDRTFTSVLARHVDGGASGTIPDLEWGFEFDRAYRRARLDGRRLSQPRLVEALKPVIDATPREIATLRQLEEPPTDQQTRRLAFAALVLIGADPTWMATTLDMTASDAGLTRDQIEELNPSWLSKADADLQRRRERPRVWDS